MAWTRVKTMGAELGSAIEYDLYDGTGPTVTTLAARVKNGARAYTVSSNTGSFGKTFSSSTTQMRGAFWLKPTGSSGTYHAVMFRWPRSDGGDDWIAWDHVNSYLELNIDDTTVDTVVDTTGAFSTMDTWRHCAMIAYADASSGWVSFYLDGTKVLEATSVDTGASFSGLYLTGKVDFVTGWASSSSVDDIYIDTGTGSEADESLSLREFGWRSTNAAGDHSAWTPSAGSNYQNVDETGANDGDTTYNLAESSGLQDSYNTTSFSVPSGYVIVSETAVVVAKKTGAGEQIKVGFTDGTNDSLSAAQDVTADYLPYYYRSETQPDGSAWNETDGNAMQVLIESAGSFS